MTSPKPSSGEFGLDLDKAREAVTALEEVYGQLVGLHTQAFDLARRPATAHDAVSVEAFELLKLKAAGPPGSGSFTAAMEAGMAHVEALITQMEADIRRQEEIDAEGQREIGLA